MKKDAMAKYPMMALKCQQAVKTIDTLVSEPRGPQVRLDRTYGTFRGEFAPMVNRSVDLKDLTGYGAETICRLTDAAKRSSVLKRHNRDPAGSLCKEGLVMESRKELVELIQEQLDTIADMGLGQELLGRKIDKTRSINEKSGLCLADKPEFRRGRNRQITRSVDFKSVLLPEKPEKRRNLADPHYQEASKRHLRQMAATISKVYSSELIEN